MKKSILLSLFSLFFFTLCFSQKTNEAETRKQMIDLKKIFFSQRNFILPETIEDLDTALGEQTEFISLEEGQLGFGSVYKWKLKNGLIVTAQTDGTQTGSNIRDNIIFVIFSASQNIKINDYLILNKTPFNTVKKIYPDLELVKHEDSSFYKVQSKDALAMFWFNDDNLLEIVEIIKEDLYTE